MSGAHVIYFIGGPLDLSKRVDPGDSPRSDRYTHRAWSPAYGYAEPPANQPASMVASDIEYRLIPAPMRGRGERRLFIAIHEGAAW